AAQSKIQNDLAVQRMKIYSIQTNLSEGTEDIGIVIDGTKVLTALGNFSRASAMLVGLTYAVNLAYPKELRYTFEAFQKLFLELDCSKLSPKVNSLKSKLLAKEREPKYTGVLSYSVCSSVQVKKKKSYPYSSEGCDVFCSLVFQK
uniref:Uncharacterized protein n=1 Tax=Cyprinodon variegatus TaxID=28743 RepID=A0A3Q2EFD0_CYPVA